MIVGVGAGIAIAQHLTLGNLTDEQHMAAQIHLLQHTAAEHCVGVFGQINQIVVAPFKAHKVREFVCFPAGLHTEMADGLKGNILRENTHIKDTGVFDDLPGEVLFLHRDGQLIRAVCHLEAGIGDAAVVDFSPSGNDKQSVGQIVQRRGVLRRFLLLSESSAPADPSEPCRDGLRHEPFRERCRGWHPDRFS